jgi:hypothetical protein
MKRKHFLNYDAAKRSLAAAILALVIGMTGCATTQSNAKSAPDEVGNATVDETTDAVADNVREGIREGVNDAFKNIFKK